MICPCQRNPNQTLLQQLLYKDCCQPLHMGEQEAETAEQLMRSRYSAFEMNLVDYIVKTTLPAMQSFLNKEAINTWSQQTDWQGLVIENIIPKIGKHHAQVEFKAYFKESGVLSFHHERSIFVQIHNENKKIWYFLDPTLGLKRPQKQPCICASGDKFKRCCGQFLI